MSTRADAPSSPAAKTSARLATVATPYLAMAISTAGGVGYLPAAPGTWGSLVGVALYYFFGARVTLLGGHSFRVVISSRLALAVAIAAALALAGMWAADRTASFLRLKDPQCIVIDEVSGQFLVYLAALAPLNWKYLLLGLILFRVFDIWKPFPAREAESLPGGLGIMADDWVAGIYAALGLWIVRAAGL
jgi:phosphatidylglycerophosphatase A